MIFDRQGTDYTEIRERITKARNAIRCLNGVLRSKEIGKTRKLRICDAIIKSTLIYGSETWRLTEANKRKIEAVEIKALRRSVRTSSF